MVKVMYNGINGLADFNVKGYKLFGNIMFYPDNGYPFYRKCINVSEIKFI